MSTPTIRITITGTQFILEFSGLNDVVGDWGDGCVVRTVLVTSKILVIVEVAAWVCTVVKKS